MKEAPHDRVPTPRYRRFPYASRLVTDAVALAWAMTFDSWRMADVLLTRTTHARRPVGNAHSLPALQIIRRSTGQGLC